MNTELTKLVLHLRRSVYFNINCFYHKVVPTGLDFSIKITFQESHAYNEMMN